MYKIKIEKFEGPLDLLLKLIQKEKMDITQISLSKVTEQYIHYIENSEDISPEELADFLVIAAKLLLIKSKSLLPYLEREEEETGFELERQLKMYKIFLEAAENLKDIIKKKNFSYFRQSNKLFEKVFIPPENINKNILKDCFKGIIHSITPIVTYKQRTIKKTISLKDKIDDIKKIVLEKEFSNFKEILGSAKNKMEIIVCFLALLELVKRRNIILDQNNIFSDISIKKINNENA
ncbi:MAG: segregation/condensation protein A [Patescibacteria group bacterium]|nr:segregation/condensation protein A [Patescibacteria group bacterium]